MKKKISITIDKDLLENIDKLVTKEDNRSLIMQNLIIDGFKLQQRQDDIFDYEELTKIVNNAVETESEKQGNRIMILFKKALTEISSTFLLIQMILMKKEKSISKEDYRKIMKGLEEKSAIYLKKRNEDKVVSGIIEDILQKEKKKDEVSDLI
ncbi:MAG: hypothetical protein MJA82_14925 [Clostridia bacterium]|nr:hypothetical protein [Clostridia bacterium]